MRIRLVDYYNEHRVALAYVSVLPGNPRRTAVAIAAAVSAAAADAVLHQRITSLLFYYPNCISDCCALFRLFMFAPLLSIQSFGLSHDISRFSRLAWTTKYNYTGSQIK